jgi:hypothetical protein
LIGHDQTPFKAVPDVGAVAVQVLAKFIEGSVKLQSALVTPARLSVKVMLQVTTCANVVVLTELGVKLNAVRTGAATSQSAKAGVAEKAVKRHKTANATRTV